MKRDRSTDLEDKYWNGTSSLEEERRLKRQKKLDYFGGLKEAKHERMDWAFADFVERTDASVIQSEKEKGWAGRLWLYGAAATVVLSLGIWAMVGENSGPEEVAQMKHTALVEPLPISKGDPKDEEPALDRPAAGRHRGRSVAARVTNPPAQNRSVVSARSAQEETSEREAANEHEAFVIVNGKPVYNEEEAEEIALASLKLMVNNFQEGKEALEKVKYIKVTL
jgi:hypothetical protein